MTSEPIFLKKLKFSFVGWAWTRAFLGIIADEIHVCGELGAAPLLQRLCETTGETVEVIKQNEFELPFR